MRRTYLMIDRAMRYVQNVMAARHEVQSIPGVLASRATQWRRVLGVALRDAPNFRPRRRCSILIWARQTASLAPGQEQKSEASHA